MNPMRISMEFYIDEPTSDDLEELEYAVRDAVEGIIGDVEYSVNDWGLSFELQDG